MTINFVQGGMSVGSTSLAAPNLGGNYGDGVLIVVTTKPDTATIATPAGWTPVINSTGGDGVSGNGTGPTRVATFWREKDATWSTLPTVTVTGGNSSIYAAWALTKDPARSWGVPVAVSVPYVSTTALSALMPSDPGLAAGDFLIGSASHQDDLPTLSDVDEAISAPGVTIFGETFWSGHYATTTNNDVSNSMLHRQVTAGASTGPATISGTLSPAGTGVATLIRMREVNTSAKISREHAEVLSGATPDSKLSRVHAEALSSVDPSRRLTRAYIEALWADNPLITDNVSAANAEVLHGIDAPARRLTKEFVEVLWSKDPTIWQMQDPQPQRINVAGWWDGAAIQPVDDLGWWDGSNIQPLS